MVLELNENMKIKFSLLLRTYNKYILEISYKAPTIGKNYHKHKSYLIKPCD